MTIHIFSIGGTGARVVRALAHCLMAGCPTGLPAGAALKVWSVDPDADSGDAVRMRRLVQSAGQLQQASRGTFMPHGLAMGSASFFPGLPSCLDQQFAHGDLPGDACLLLQGLVGGERLRRSTPYIIKEDVAAARLFYAPLPDSEGYRLFLDEWNPYQDRVVLVGSTFGTVGAAGLPVLAQLLMQHHPEARVDVVAVGPYFRVNTPQGGVTDSDTFLARHRLLTTYLRRTLGTDGSRCSLSTLLLPPSLLSTFAYAEGGQQQQNPAHVMELQAALQVLCVAATDFSSLERTVPHTEQWTTAQPLTTEALFGPDTWLRDGSPRDLAQALQAHYVWSRYVADRLLPADQKAKADAVLRPLGMQQGTAPFTSQLMAQLTVVATDYDRWLREMGAQALPFTVIAPQASVSVPLSQCFPWTPQRRNFSIFSPDPLALPQLDSALRRTLGRQNQAQAPLQSLFAALRDAVQQSWQKFC